MTQLVEGDTGGLRNSVLALLDRLDPLGHEMVEGWFRRLGDEPVHIEEAEMVAAVRPYSWLLARIGEGITLTGAGYLPPAVVHQTVIELGWDREWIGAANREYHTLPVLELRESARRVGLVRKHRGRLVRTARGTALTGDPVRLWQHLAEHTPTERDNAAADAGLLLLLATAAGIPLSWERIGELVAAGLTSLGWRDGAGGELRSEHAWGAVRDTWHTLRRLHVLPDAPYRTLVSPPTAGVAFARAAIRSSIS